MSIYRFRVFLLPLALTIGAGALQGTALVANSTGTSMTCNAGATTTSSTLSVTITLPGAGTAATSVAVAQSLSTGLTVTAPTSTAVNSGPGTTWTFKEPSGCLAAATDTITFTPTGGNTSAVTVTATLGAPTNTFLSITGAGSAANNQLLVYCNAATGVTTASVNVAAGAGAGALTSNNKLTVAISQIAVTADTSTNYSAGTLSNSPVTVTGAGSFYTGNLPLTLGVKSATCANLSANSNTTTAIVTFTTAVGSATANVDTVLLYVKVTQQAPVTATSAITLQCLPGSPGTVIAPLANNVTVSTQSSAAVNVSVTSSSWVTLAIANGSPVAGGPVTGGPTSATPLAISAALGGCAGLKTAGQTATGTISVGPGTGSAWASVPVSVTLQVVNGTPLTATPVTLPLTYRKGGASATGTIAVSSSSAAGSYFTVVGVSGLGAYFTADTASGTAPKSPGTRVITFSTTSLNDTLSPGTTTYQVNLHVAGCQDSAVYVKVTVNDAAPVLTVAEGTTRSITWDPSTSVPAPVVTLVSSDTPIAYTIASTSGIVIGPTTGGLAFSYGTQINVAFDPAAFQSASPGQTLTGKLTVAGGGATIPITFNVLVTSASTQANLGAISPGNLPTGTPGQVFTLNLYGSGFISSSTPNYTTVVGLASSAIASGFSPHEPGISSVKVLNASTIVITLTVPSGGSDIGSGGLLNFNTSGSVYIGVCNPNGSNCTPGTALPLTIGSGPSITSITSSSSFAQFSGTAQGTPAAAPYDMVSIFGSNFCNSGGTGCGANVIMGTIVNNAYSTSLSPDGSRLITVNIYSHPAGTLSSATPIAQAPLLFATNNQINALLPGDITNNTALQTAITAGIVDIAVSFGGAFSNAMPVAVATTDPGIFTIGSDGVGDAAALQISGATPAYTLISGVSPAIIRPSGSDTVQIYGTGLGAPDTNNSSCITVSAYDGAFSPPLQFIDGALLQSSVMGGLSAPCFKTPTTSAAVKFGAVASGTEGGAGWVTIPGLYYVNATIPGNASPMTDSSATVTAPFTAPMQVNVTVANGSNPSQAGVTMWVAPQLTMGTFDPASCGATTFTSYTCAFPTVSGTSNTIDYTYAGAPTALGCSGSSCTGSSAPAAGSYLISATATDHNHDMLSITGSFNVYVTNPSTQTIQLTGTTPTPSVYGTPNNAVTTVSVTGGTSTYTYSVTTGGTFASVNSSGVVSFTASAPVGSNQIVISVTDNNDSTQTGTLAFYAAVAPQLNSSNGAWLTANTASTSTVTLTTLSALGITGASYTVVQAPTGVAVVNSALQFTGGNSLAAGTYSITVKGADSTPHTGFINLSLHLN